MVNFKSRILSTRKSSPRKGPAPQNLINVIEVVKCMYQNLKMLKTRKKRRQQDLNLRVQSTFDFKSNTLTTRS